MKAKQNINMFWYRMTDRRENFGDVLGPYLVNKLSGKKINYVFLSPKENIFKSYIKGLLNRRFDASDFPSIIKSVFAKEVLISIGSIISFINHPRNIIWGSGIIKRDENIKKATFCAVRGKYTQQRLRELGIVAPAAIGDPALLLPLVLDGELAKKYKLGLVPHYVQFEETRLKYANNEDVLIINLLDSIEDVVKNITSCERTISTSLHGLIVSHCYYIPSLWYDFSTTNGLIGDNVKFLDYFSSVAIREYKPFHLENFDLNDVINTFNGNANLALIQNDLSQTQRSLLEAAPFSILKKFKDN